MKKKITLKRRTLQPLDADPSTGPGLLDEAAGGDSGATCCETCGDNDTCAHTCPDTCGSTCGPTCTGTCGCDTCNPPCPGCSV